MRCFLLWLLCSRGSQYWIPLAGAAVWCLFAVYVLKWPLATKLEVVVVAGTLLLAFVGRWLVDRSVAQHPKPIMAPSERARRIELHASEMFALSCAVKAMDEFFDGHLILCTLDSGPTVLMDPNDQRGGQKRRVVISGMGRRWNRLGRHMDLTEFTVAGECTRYAGSNWSQMFGSLQLPGEKRRDYIALRKNRRDELDPGDVLGKLTVTGVTLGSGEPCPSWLRSTESASD